MPCEKLNIYILNIFIWLNVRAKQLHHDDLSSFLHNKLDKYAQQGKSFSSISNTVVAVL